MKLPQQIADEERERSAVIFFSWYAGSACLIFGLGLLCGFSGMLIGVGVALISSALVESARP